MAHLQPAHVLRPPELPTGFCVENLASVEVLVATTAVQELAALLLLLILCRAQSCKLFVVCLKIAINSIDEHLQHLILIVELVVYFIGLVENRLTQLAELL